MAHLQDIGLLNSLFTFSDLSFAIDSIIIESGQRTVYRGHNNDWMPVVIKVLVQNEIKVGRIQREIKILNEINSQYFPRFHCQAFISKGIIEDYVDNLDVAKEKERIDELIKNPPGPFFVTCEEFIENIGWAEFEKKVSNELMLVDFVIHLFNALEILWNNKIVHRDIKPDNILIRPDLRPVIIDLGVAKSLREGTKNLTLLGLAPCTPQYAAPEQFETGAEVTYKADQFAVGVILYHLVTGVFPYGRYNEIELEGLLHNFKTILPKQAKDINGKISQGFTDFLHRLLEVQPYKRYRNIFAIQETLQAIRGTILC